MAIQGPCSFLLIVHVMSSTATRIAGECTAVLQAYLFLFSLSFFFCYFISACLWPYLRAYSLQPVVHSTDMEA